MNDLIPSNRLAERRDFVNLGILFLICLTIGVYLILTTVLIANDGVFYIERAQAFSSDPIRIIEGRPFGYPFLIYMAHKVAGLFSASSVYSWIYSAQSVSLLCRLIALGPLYFIGKYFVGGRKAFMGIFILVILP